MIITICRIPQQSDDVAVHFIVEWGNVYLSQCGQ